MEKGTIDNKIVMEAEKKKSKPGKVNHKLKDILIPKDYDRLLKTFNPRIVEMLIAQGISSEEIEKSIRKNSANLLFSPNRIDGTATGKIILPLTDSTKGGFWYLPCFGKQAAEKGDSTKTDLGIEYAIATFVHNSVMSRIGRPTTLKPLFLSSDRKFIAYDELPGETLKILNHRMDAGEREISYSKLVDILSLSPLVRLIMEVEVNGKLEDITRHLDGHSWSKKIEDKLSSYIDQTIYLQDSEREKWKKTLKKCAKCLDNNSRFVVQGESMHLDNIYLLNENPSDILILDYAGARKGHPAEDLARIATAADFPSKNEKELAMSLQGKLITNLSQTQFPIGDFPKESIDERYFLKSYYAAKALMALSLAKGCNLSWINKVKEENYFGEDVETKKLFEKRYLTDAENALKKFENG